MNFDSAYQALKHEQVSYSCKDKAKAYKRINNYITKTCLFKYMYTENFTTKKWKFSDKNSDIFHISAQNIDCGYSLEPPRRGGSNGYPQSIFEQK